MWGLIIGGFIVVVAIALHVEGRIGLLSLIALLIFALFVGFAIANFGSIKKFSGNLRQGALSLENFEEQADKITKDKLDEIKAEVDGQKKQLSNVIMEANETREELERVAEMAAPPLLSLKSQQQVATREGEHRILLKFESTKNTPLGNVIFRTDILDGTQATMRGLRIGAMGGTYGESKTSNDGKTETQEYIPVGSDLDLTVDVSAPCRVRISGSHMKEPLEVEIK